MTCPQCSATYRDGAYFCTSCGRRQRVEFTGLKKAYDWCATAFGIIMVFVLLLWAGTVYYAPHLRPNPDEIARATDALQVVRAEFTSHLPDTAEVRLEQHLGLNLTVWLWQADFESIPYPDRKDFVTSVGRCWCDYPAFKGHGLFPSIAIRDLRSGKELASYTCSRSRASLN